MVEVGAAAAAAAGGGRGGGGCGVRLHFLITALQEDMVRARWLALSWPGRYNICLGR